MFAALFIWGISHGLSQANVNNTSCITSPTGEVEFTTLVRGVVGPQGQKGEQGIAGQVGRRGFPGPNFTKKIQELEKDFSMKISKITASLMAIQECGTYNSSWREIAYIDTTVISTANDQCQQYGLRSVSDKNQVACGKPGEKSCSVHVFGINGTYSHVCGRVRGYNLKKARGFHVEPKENRDKIYSHYADGVLITRGNLSQHLWTYAASVPIYGCPCDTDDQVPYSRPLTVTGTNYACESTRTGWDQPLWDRPKHTVADNNCTRHVNGWFYQNVKETNESIEVRWCGPEKDDIVTDKLQIWVQ